MVTRDAKLLKKVRTSAQGVLGENGVTKAGFDEALDGFRVVGFHDHAGSDAELFEEAVNDEAHVAALRIKKERLVGEIRGRQRGDVPAANVVGARSDDEELFVEKGKEAKLSFRDG